MSRFTPLRRQRTRLRALGDPPLAVADEPADRAADAAANHATIAFDRTRDALARDEAAQLRDISAQARDLATEARDLALEHQEALFENGPPPDPTITALKQFAMTVRARAAADRVRAAADRARAAEDRAQAAQDRRQAHLDLERAYRDDLTGVYTRGLGLLKVEHEIQRAHRSGEPFVLAFLDVDGLKEINDRHGHARGDAVLRAIGTELRARLRVYDPVVRVGGDEFVCTFSNTDLAAAAGRLDEIRAALANTQPLASLSAGFALLHRGETLEDLTARGDAELYRAKHA